MCMPPCLVVNDCIIALIIFLSIICLRLILHEHLFVITFDKLPLTFYLWQLLFNFGHDWTFLFFHDA